MANCNPVSERIAYEKVMTIIHFIIKILSPINSESAYRRINIELEGITFVF